MSEEEGAEKGKFIVTVKEVVTRRIYTFPCTKTEARKTPWNYVAFVEEVGKENMGWIS